MVPHRERILARSAKDLADETRKRPGDWMTIFRRFRKLEEHRLWLWHNAGGGGREVGRQRSDLVDILFRELFETFLNGAEGKGAPDRVAVVAFGGYGRREMNPFSDVDIMFLLPRGKPSARLENVIRQTLTALWDLGYKVGHATRSIPQAIELANEDPLTKTAMLERRFLTGDREVFNALGDRFERDCVTGKEAKYIKWRFESQAENREKYGGSVFMQEPNVKNGRGGLRDYQNLLWIAKFKERIPSMAKLAESKYLRQTERRRLDKAYDFIMRVRTEMHYQNERAIDGMTLRLQGQIATAFRYPQKTILRRCEAFMRDYYSHAREIDHVTTAVIERLNVVPEEKESKLMGLFSTSAKAERFDGFVSKNGLISAQNREIFRQDPFRMLRVFQHMQTRQLVMDPELADLIRRRPRVIDRTFQYSRVGREIFLSILSHKGKVGRILRSMHDLGVIGRYLPEFGALTCLVQHEFFHRYTADEHTLVCIEKLDGLLFAEERRFAGYRSLFQKLEDPGILYLAVLLHDTGKAANTQHHEDESAMLAHRVARRLQLSPKRRRMLITLVDAHYTLSHTAQTRNLEDPTTIAVFAKVVQNRSNLDALMLLTVADGMGTSGDNWSDWKEALVWSLFRQTSHFLEGGPDEPAKEARELAKAAVTKALPKSYAEEIDAQFDYMPERYFRSFDAEDITNHLRLFHRFFERLRSVDTELALTPVIEWTPRPQQAHTEVWLCGWDRDRFVERVAGAFVAARLNILSADIFTRGDNLALDVFRVADSRHSPVENDRDIKRFETALQQSLEHFEYDFTPFFRKASPLRSYRVSHEVDRPARVVFDNLSHPVFTIIEIQTPDRLGLLYNLLRAFGQEEITIGLSRVTTEMEIALDTFYVLSRDGSKITDRAVMGRLERLLVRAAKGQPDGNETTT
ncbi:MAG: [protein-PII] uridylyltransferase [Chthoniobacterales bacterium]